MITYFFCSSLSCSWALFCSYIFAEFSYELCFVFIVLMEGCNLAFYRFQFAIFLYGEVLYNTAICGTLFKLTVHTSHTDKPTKSRITFHAFHKYRAINWFGFTIALSWKRFLIPAWSLIYDNHGDITWKRYGVGFKSQKCPVVRPGRFSARSLYKV